MSPDSLPGDESITPMTVSERITLLIMSKGTKEDVYF